MIVISANDFPFCVVPEGTTLEQAISLCKFLAEADPVNIEQRRQYPHTKGLGLYRVYYRARDVPMMSAAEVQNDQG